MWRGRTGSEYHVEFGKSSEQWRSAAWRRSTGGDLLAAGRWHALRGSHVQQWACRWLASALSVAFVHLFTNTTWMLDNIDLVSFKNWWNILNMSSDLCKFRWSYLTLKVTRHILLPLVFLSLTSFWLNSFWNIESCTFIIVSIPFNYVMVVSLSIKMYVVHSC